MKIKDFDDIQIPENLNDYIDKGINKGIEHNSKNKNNKVIKIASIVIISVIILTAGSNIPVLAKELVKVPIVGELVKVLDFTESTSSGGVITDGNKIVIDTLNKNSINIYFTEEGKLSNNSPHYKVEYREYPYTLVFTFSGVRYLDSTYIEEKVDKLPFVNDVYKIITLDDSSYRVAIELNKNIDFKVAEYQNPAMIELKVKPNNQKSTTKQAYFIRTQSLEQGEQLASIEEMLYQYDDKGIQKCEDGKYIVQIGPYETKEEADKMLKQITEETNLGINLFIESRMTGEQPK